MRSGIKYALAALVLGPMVCSLGQLGRNSPHAATMPAPYQDMDVSYLPWEFPSEGCAFRATYLAMEMAVRGQPSAVQIIDTCSHRFELVGPQGEAWRFHAAVVIDLEGQRWIVDPLMGGELLTPGRWRWRFGNAPVNLFLNPAANPFPSNDEVGCGLDRGRDNLPPTLSGMVPWALDNVMVACAYLKGLLDELEPPNSPRHRRLVQRTHELVQGLRPLGLLDEGGDLPAVVEARERLIRGPWCPPAPPHRIVGPPRN